MNILKVFLFSILLIAVFTIFSNSDISPNNVNKYIDKNQNINSNNDDISSQKVYVCLGKYAKRYHLYLYCDGLDNCKGEIVSMSKSDAENMGRTLCSRCRRLKNELNK